MRRVCTALGVLAFFGTLDASTGGVCTAGSAHPGWGHVLPVGPPTRTRPEGRGWTAGSAHPGRGHVLTVGSPPPISRLRGGGDREHLKIALCAWESLYSVAVGGVAPHVSELARGLSKLGHEAHLYVRMGASNQKHYEIIDGVHVHRVPIELNSDFVKECVPVMFSRLPPGVPIR